MAVFVKFVAAQTFYQKVNNFKQHLLLQIYITNNLGGTVDSCRLIATRSWFLVGAVPFCVEFAYFPRVRLGFLWVGANALSSRQCPALIVLKLNSPPYLHRLKSYSACFGCTLGCLIRVWYWLLRNPLTCANISINVVTGITRFEVCWERLLCI